MLKRYGYSTVHGTQKWAQHSSKRAFIWVEALRDGSHFTDEDRSLVWGEALKQPDYRRGDKSRPGCLLEINV
jgi:hypothetical protein